LFGRIHPDKGAREAVEVARQTGHKLVLAGFVQDADDFARHIEPFIDGHQISYVGAVGPH
jgi:glycosyltransferase involved in cell wall biosynthesis